MGAAWAAFEVGSAGYDDYNAVETVFSDASVGEKLTSVGLAGVSILGPGGGYTTIGDNLRHVGKVRTGRRADFARVNTDLSGGFDEATDLFQTLTGREVPGSLDRQVLEDGREIVIRSSSRTGGPKIEVIDPEAEVVEEITFLGGGGS